MGLTAQSTGIGAMDNTLKIDRLSGDIVAALAGNPNVGKSTVFNGLTGLKQHTGSWPGKTVANAQGRCRGRNKAVVLVDLPGTYSLMAGSAEEEAARDFICFGGPDCTVVVADATCLMRNLNLVLQTLEITGRVVVCVNLMDEARRKGVNVDTDALAARLGVPVVGCAARSGHGLSALMDAVRTVAQSESAPVPAVIGYGPDVEKALALLEPAVTERLKGRLPGRWTALKLLDGDTSLMESIRSYLGFDLPSDAVVAEALAQAQSALADAGIGGDTLRDIVVSSLTRRAESVCAGAVRTENSGYTRADRRIDKVLTSRVFGLPVMLALLALMFWLTLAGANYPSQLLSSGLFWVEDQLTALFSLLGAPEWLHGLLVLGMYRTLAWVVSVMLPPMAIFFPLFTLLEDLGYLPRVAFNLDKSFKRACACGKQALTMCMGLGCNAAGVVGCRIIESPRERLIAIITNNFMPCNGRFPTLIAIITMFFAAASGVLYSVISALALVGVILLGIFMTLLVSKLLSKTLLKGLPSSFTLELPPYRRPQILRVIGRSLVDRTLFVLGAPPAAPPPAGLVIWLLANADVNGVSLLAHAAGFLDPFARFLGLDGFILMAFILGFPANEIVIPIVILSYMATGSLTDMSSLADLRALLVSHGWTWLTAVCVMLFSLMHWPCGTTCWTIRKETGSWKWTAVSFLVPTVCGMLACFVVANLARLLGLA